MNGRGEERLIRRTAAKRLTSGDIDRETARRIASLLREGDTEAAGALLFESTDRDR